MASTSFVAPSCSVITIGTLPLTTRSPLVSSQVGMNEILLCAGIPTKILPSASAFSGTRIFSLGVMLSLSVCPMLYLSPSSTIKISLCFPPNAISPLAAFSRACAGRLMDDAFEKSIDARLDSSSDFSGLQTLNFTLVPAGIESPFSRDVSSFASTRFTLGVVAISFFPSLLLISSLVHSGKSAILGFELSKYFAPLMAMDESSVVVKTKSHFEYVLGSSIRLAAAPLRKTTVAKGGTSIAFAPPPSGSCTSNGNCTATSSAAFTVFLRLVFASSMTIAFAGKRSSTGVGNVIATTSLSKNRAVPWGA